MQMNGSLPTPSAGRMFTSRVTSSGSSSRLETSIGPLMEPTIVYPRAVCVAEPSGFCSVFTEDEARFALILMSRLVYASRVNIGVLAVNGSVELAYM